MSVHDDLVTAAKEAINAVFGDKSVRPQKTLESIEELSDECDTLITALRADLRDVPEEEDDDVYEPEDEVEEPFDDDREDDYDDESP